MGDGKLKSEAAELDAFIAALESAREVKDIAGWRSGFTALDASLNGLARGLYLVVGAPAAGKTAFVKQLCDQAARLNSVPAVFFTLGERKKDLSLRTLARLSGLETHEIRRGAGYLLHAYGVSKQNVAQEEMAPGWEKLKAAAAGAKSWLDRLYVIEGDARTTLEDIERNISAAREAANTQSLLVVIDDAQRLGAAATALDERLPLVVERLSELALRLDLPLLATWPELGSAGAPEHWAERAVGADAVLVLREDKTIPETVARGVTLHIVKNRVGDKTKIAFDFTPGLAKFSER